MSPDRTDPHDRAKDDAKQDDDVVHSGEEVDAESSEEREEIRHKLHVPARLIYKVIEQEGMHELTRPLASLWWSGVAAGIAIGFSVVAQALLRAQLPDTQWRPLVDSTGYSVGFLIVIMARKQLFTENTLTEVLPLIVKPSRGRLLQVARLWGTVFSANMVGACLFAVFMQYSGAFSDEVLASARAIAEHLLANSWAEMYARAVVAGWLIAAMVWILPNAGFAEPFVIVLLTWLIAAGSFAHIIAGSVEMFLLVVSGTISPETMLAHFTIPVLLGNVMGGTALFALIVYAQVREEL